MSSNTKKKGKFGKRLLVWFCALMLIFFVASPFVPKDANGDAITPDWYSYTVLFVPIIAAIFYDKIKWRTIPEAINRLLRKNAYKKSKVDAENFIPPKTKNGQAAVAKSLLNNMEVCISLANKETSIALFVAWYDEALQDCSKLMQLNKVSFKGSPSLDFYRLKDEFQWHLCDAIVRGKEFAISEIKEKYTNSREFQKKSLDKFERDINGIRSRFSPDTATLADESIKEIREILGIECADSVASPHQYSQFSQYSSVDAELANVDLMEGHEFERWCADLLRKNGFTNVNVTPGSGDQGVDVLAEKDGIKYAIQCKCYSSNLGNPPVQEVHTGKQIYHCQIGAVMTNRYFTKGAKDAADATGILLWDRDKLKELIESAKD